MSIENTDQSTILAQKPLVITPDNPTPTLSAPIPGQSDMATMEVKGGFPAPTFAELVMTSPELKTAMSRWNLDKVVAAKGEIEKAFGNIPQTDDSFDHIARALGLQSHQPVWMDVNETKQVIPRVKSELEFPKSGFAPTTTTSENYTPSELPTLPDGSQAKQRQMREGILGIVPFGLPIAAGLTEAEDAQGGWAEKMVGFEKGVGGYVIDHPFTFALDSLATIPPVGAAVGVEVARGVRGLCRATGLSKAIVETPFGKIFYPPLSEFTIGNKHEYNEILTAIKDRGESLTYMTPEIHDSIVGFVKGSKADLTQDAFVDGVVDKLKKVESTVVESNLASKDAKIKEMFPAGAVWPIDNVGKVRGAESLMDKVMAERVPTSWKTGKDNLLEQVYRVFVDNLRPVQKRLEELTAGGKAIPPKYDIYNQLLIFNSRAGALIEQEHARVIQPVLDVLKEKGVDLTDLHNYLSATQEIAMNAAKNPGAKQIHRGFKSVEEARAVLDELKSAGIYNTLEEIAPLVRTIDAEKRKVLVESGLYSEKAIDGWIKKYTDQYAPVKGFLEEEGVMAKSGTDAPFSARFKPNRDQFGRPAEGRVDLGKNAFVQMCKDYQSVVVAGELNGIKQNFYGLVAEYPNPKVWEIKPIYGKDGQAGATVDGLGAHIDPETRKLPGWVNKLPKDSNGRLTNDVVVYFNGVPAHIRVTDPEFGSALNGLGPTGLSNMIGMMGTAGKWMDGLIRASSQANRGLSEVYTSFSPGFLVTNFSRDLQEGILSMTSADSFKIAGDIVANAPKELWSYYRRTPEYIAKTERFRNAGAETAFYGRPTFDDTYATIKRYLENPLDDPSIPSKIKSKVEYLNKSVENMWRKSTFDVLVDKYGYSEELAAQAAKSITINFDRHGQVGYYLNAYKIFANAGIQGADKFLRICATPAGQDIAAGIVGGAYSMAEMNRVVGGVDRNGVPNWDKVGDARDRYTIFMTGNKGSYVKMPSPYGFGFLAQVGYTMNDLQHYLQQKNSGQPITIRKSPPEMLVNLGKSFLSNFNPLTGESFDLAMLAPSWMETGIRPFVNKSSFGGEPIYTERTGDYPGIPYSQLGYAKTGEGYKMASREIGKAGANLSKWYSGEDKKVDEVTSPPGWADVPPEGIRAMVQGYGGGPATFLSKLVTTIAGIYKKDSDVRDLPIVGSLLNPGDYSRDTNEQFNKNLEAVTKITSNYNFRVKNKPESFAGGNPYTNKEYTIGTLVETLTNIKESIGELRTAASVTPNITPEVEKRYRDNILNLKETFNRLYKDLVHTQTKSKVEAQ